MSDAAGRRPEATEPAAAGGSSPAAGLPRREFLRRSAVAGGGFAGLWAVPAVVREAYGEPIEIPKAARSVEAGLALFVAKWEAAAPVVSVTRFGQFISDKVFNCRVADQPRSYTLRMGTAGAALSPGIDPFRHADMVMTEEDWLGTLYGDFTGLAALVNGAAFPSRDAANKVALLGIVMYLFAHLPAGYSPPDPELLARVLQSLLRHGIPECAGEYDAFDEVNRLVSDPGKGAKEVLLPGVKVPPVTRILAEFVAGLRYEDLPPGTIVSAKEQLKSIIACMYAGSRMAPGRKFRKAVKGFGDRPEATVIGRAPFRTSARHAALLNSVYAQILEWEDWTFIAHSGASVVPTALAAAELGRASGKELLAAVVAGNEILARSGGVLTDVLHTGNAVATHQIETPLIAGTLLGLDAGGLQDAVGICCTQPQVTSIPAWTADAKGLLTGWPVLVGMESAQYAKAGVSGRRDILENPIGYCYSVSDIPTPSRLERLVEELGKTWRFDAARSELFTKRFPTDGFQLTAVQAILDIVNKQAKEVFDSTPREKLPETVKRVQVRVPWVMGATATMFERGSKSLYDRVRNEPDWTYIALLFDGKYPLAAALVSRRLTFHEYIDKVIFDPVVQAMVEKIELIPDLAMGVLGAEARIELADGRGFESRQECIDEFPVDEKLYLAAEGILPRRRIKAILRAVDRLESFKDARDFVRIAAGGRTARPR